MPSRFLALIFLLGLAPLPVRAVIGDDLAALRAAYGPAKRVGDQMIFLHAGFSIAVYFDGTHSAMEIFVPDDSHAKKTDFTPKDVDGILALEGGGRPWNPVQTRSGQPTWLTADGKLIARFNPGEKILAILVNSQ